MAPRSSSLEAGSSQPRKLRARLLRCLLDALFPASVRQPRRSRGFFTRGGRCRNGNATAQRAANSSNSIIAATHRGQEGPVMVTAYCPRHGPSSYPCGNDGSSSLEYTPATPPNSPTPDMPPEFLLRGMITAHRGAPHFSMTAGSSSAIAPATPPPPPPPALSTAGLRSSTACGDHSSEEEFRRRVFR